jgi:hypothetical protein
MNIRIQKVTGDFPTKKKGRSSPKLYIIRAGESSLFKIGGSNKPTMISAFGEVIAKRCAEWLPTANGKPRDDEPFFDGGAWETPPGEPWPNGPDSRAPKFRRIINPAEWEGLPIPPREWIVPGYIPHKTVTLLSGDGSVGKSLLALQLAAGRALAREWIGLLPEPGRTLILSTRQATRRSS